MEYADAAEENPAQAYRRELIFSRLGITGSGAGARLLDIGSGQGDMAAAVRVRFPKVEILGVELSRSGIEISGKKVPSARFVQRDLVAPGTVPADQHGWATHAVCSEVIEHVDEPGLLLRNAREYMAPGCRLVVTVPGGPMSAFDRHIGHRRHYSRSGMRSLLRETGYEPLHVTGAGFPFFNLYRSVVILRGKKLIEDVRSGRGGSTSGPARTAMVIFDRLFRLNADSSPWGWQIVATAAVGIPKPAE